MIVKNESRIISRLIDSCLDFIDSYCIVDTGSSDNTVEIIREIMKDKKGKILHKEFVDFAYNRTFALEEAEGIADYFLLLDADHILEVEDKNFKDKLTLDVYSLKELSDNCIDWKPRIVKAGIGAHYNCPTHEYIHWRKEKVKIGRLEGVIVKDVGDGGSKEDKYERDLRLLHKALESENKDRPRILFYLSQSYCDLKRYDEAIEYLDMRIKAGGWKEEIYISYLRKGRIYLAKEKLDLAKESFFWGYRCIPDRAECAFELTKFYLRNKNIEMSDKILSGVFNFSKYNLFREKYLEEEGLDYLKAILFYMKGYVSEARRILERLCKSQFFGELASRDLLVFK